MVQIDKDLIKDLFDKAVVSKRKRMNYDLRTSSEDGGQRMLNALMRELVTAGQLKRVPRTENNPHGLLIVNWRTLLNKDIEQKTKINY